MVAQTIGVSRKRPSRKPTAKATRRPTVAKLKRKGAFIVVDERPGEVMVERKGGVLGAVVYARSYNKNHKRNAEAFMRLDGWDEPDHGILCDTTIYVVEDAVFGTLEEAESAAKIHSRIQGYPTNISTAHIPACICRKLKTVGKQKKLPNPDSLY